MCVFFGGVFLGVFVFLEVFFFCFFSGEEEVGFLGWGFGVGRFWVLLLVWCFWSGVLVLGF